MFAVSKNLRQNVTPCEKVASHDSVVVSSECNICSANIRHVWGQLSLETCEASEPESDIISAADNKI